MSDIAIRNFMESDSDKLMPLIRELHAIHSAARPDIYVKDFPIDNYFEDTEDHGAIFVAVDGNEPVGFCVVNYLDRKNPVLMPARIAYIDDICVSSGMRGKGIGRKLFEHACGEARRVGADKVELNVYSFNESARKFYESMGMSVENYRMEKML